MISLKPGLLRQQTPTSPYGTKKVRLLTVYYIMSRITTRFRSIDSLLIKFVCFCLLLQQTPSSLAVQQVTIEIRPWQSPICVKSLDVCYGCFQELLEEWEQWEQPAINHGMQEYMHCFFSLPLSPAAAVYTDISELPFFPSFSAPSHALAPDALPIRYYCYRQQPPPPP